MSSRKFQCVGSNEYAAALKAARRVWRPSGSVRVDRGGGWDGYAIDCRTAYRYDRDPSIRNYGIGFRSVLPPGQ